MGRKKKAEVSKHFEEQKKERQNRILTLLKKLCKTMKTFGKSSIKL
jgi:hypothetical protein